MNKVNKSFSRRWRASVRLIGRCPSVVRALNPRSLVLLAWFAIGLDSISATPQPPRLLLLSQDAATMRLSVTNAYVPNVNLQGSFNLKDWFLLQSATPLLGTASFTLTNTEPIDAWFFRAVAAPAPPVINVGPQPDPSQSEGALILPETGGQIQITDANGVFYQLTVRSNLVTEPTAIRMTIITNFTGMPLTNRYRAAVAFEPDGFEFRGAAELKIRFPGLIPMLEIVGYGFDGAGGDFHLRPWEPETNEVTLAVTHFSGTGVAAEPFQVTGGFNQTYERGLTYTRDAIRNADNWAGDRLRETSRSRHDGNITGEEFLDSMASIRRLRDRLVYENAIAPLLGAAARDCAVGEVVIKRLDQLEGSSAGAYGQGAFYQEILKLAPSVRCNCAHYYIDRCEKDPAASGLGSTRGLTETLEQIELATGRADAQGCDLGSDNEMYERLAKAKCHMAWEGVVRYHRVKTSRLEIVSESSSSSFRSDTDVRDELSYKGRMTAVIEHDGDLLENGFYWESWRLKHKGTFAASLHDGSVVTNDNEDWTVIDGDVTKGLANLAAEGELFLRFDEGEFKSVSAEAGLDGVKYQMALKETTERKVTCKGAQQNCPDPIPAETKANGSQDLYFAMGPSKGDPTATITWANGKLTILQHLGTTNLLAAPFVGSEESVEDLRIELFRGSGQ